MPTLTRRSPPCRLPARLSIAFTGVLAGVLAAAMLAGVTGAAMAEEGVYGPDVLSTRFGPTGLLQTPSARFAGPGEFRVGFSNVHPYRSVHITAEPLPRVQATFKYISIQDRSYGTANHQQSGKDKSFDAKFLLLREGDWWPALAVGLIDFGGTGLFSSEYLVASRRIHDFDISVGLAWGRLGARGGVRNPLSGLSDRFRYRERDDAPGGTLNTGKYFSGERIHPFGGVQWTPGNGPFSVIVEYDGNDFSTDATGRPREVDSAINVGVNYRMWNALDLGLSWERGNTLGFSVSFRTDFSRARPMLKLLDPPPVALQPQPPAASAEPVDSAAVVEALRARLDTASVTARAVHLDVDTGIASLWFSQGRFEDPAQATGRAARAASSVLPGQFHSLDLVELEGDVPLYRVRMPRETLHQATALTVTADELVAASDRPAPEPGAHRRADFAGLADGPSASFHLAPGVRYNIGRPDGFVVGQLLLMAHGQLQLTPRLSLAASYGYSLVDNVDKIEVDFPSALPRVRSHTSRYLQEGRGFLRSMEANYVLPLGEALIGRLTAGITDEMFGGVAGELLYRPMASRWAVGVNVARMRQRDFRQGFDFMDYEVTTGHLSLYYELPWQDLLLQLSGGQYLAGDRGGTIDLSRRFASGVRIGAWATFTNVSKEDFGEGSFDKGFYLYLPFDLFVPYSVKGGANFMFRPMTRDGGQKVRDGTPLYFQHRGRSMDSLMNNPGHMLR